MSATDVSEERQGQLIEHALWDQAELTPTPEQLRVLADWHEEQGDNDLAYALRWAARRELLPVAVEMPSLGRAWLWRKNDLPRPLYHALGTNLMVGHGRLFESAFRALADALAELRRIAPPDPTTGPGGPA